MEDHSGEAPSLEDLERRATAEIGPEKLELLKQLPRESLEKLLALASQPPTKRGQGGRKKGSGYDASGALARMADLSLDNPDWSTWQLARTVAPDFAISAERLRKLYSASRNDLLAAARKRREPLPPPPKPAPSQPAATPRSAQPPSDIAAAMERFSATYLGNIAKGLDHIGIAARESYEAGLRLPSASELRKQLGILTAAEMHEELKKTGMVVDLEAEHERLRALYEADVRAFLARGESSTRDWLNAFLDLTGSKTNS